MIKKLFVSTILLFVVNLAVAQSIFNNGFENWTTVTYKNPQNYFTSNLQNNHGYTNPVNVMQTANAYSNNFAVQLNTVLVGNDTAAAYVANGDPSHPAGQGIPYNQKPTGVRLYYKCDVMPGDSAGVFLMFKAGGSIISQNIQKITGTQIGYTLLTFSVNLITTPDSLIFGASSSNIFGNSKGIPGSMLQIDSVSFTGVTSQPLLMNGDFENWQNLTNNTLQNWTVQQQSNNNNVVNLQTTDAYLGTYALELQTLGTNKAGDTAYSTSASTGYSTFTGIAGGLPYTQMNDSLIFYYKYAPVNPNDSGAVILQFKNAGVSFQFQSQLLKASATYKRVAMAINLSQTPDSVIVSINSSKNWNVPPSYLGADLKIDNIYFKSQPLIRGAALNFDGVDDVVSISNSLSSQFSNSQITVEGWFYPTAYAPVSNPVPALITENFLGDGNVQFDMNLDGPDQLLVSGFFDGSWHTISAPYVLNQWQHYACTYDQQNLVLYINGVQVATTPLTNPLPLGNDGWRIGQRWDNPDFYQGSMDEVRIWNRALCAAEIQNNMTAEIPKNANGLVAYYKFNQGTNGNNNSTITTLADSTGNGFDGTLNNFALMGTTSNFVTPGAVTTGSMVPAFVSTVATQTNVACHGNANGTASVAVTGAAGPFTYSWSPGGGSGPAKGSLLAGNYTCTINYACGTSAQTFTISEPTQLMVTATSGTINCNGGATTITVSATGGTPTYSNTGTFSVTANSYTYTVIDAKNCAATTTVTVNEPAQLMVTATAGTIHCNGAATTVTVSATGGTTPYAGAGTFTATANSYSYTVTDAHACATTTTVTITQPNAIASTQSPTLCASTHLIVGTHTYTTAGTYTDVLTAHNGCDSTVTTHLAFHNVINVSVTVNSPTITANNASATSYQWMDCNPPNPIISGATHQSYVAITNGNYEVLITEGSCTATSTCTTISNIGITQYNATNNLQVYPNPFSNELTIVSATKTNAMLFDMLGNKINEFVLQNTTQTISLSDLAPGMYYLQVDNSKIKIIKQ